MEPNVRESSFLLSIVCEKNWSVLYDSSGKHERLTVHRVDYQSRN